MLFAKLIKNLTMSATILLPDFKAVASKSTTDVSRRVNGEPILLQL